MVTRLSSFNVLLHPSLPVASSNSLSHHYFRLSGLPKGSVASRPEPGTAHPASSSGFDTAGSSRILDDAAKRKRTSDKVATPKRKKARSVARSSREESEPDIVIRRVSSVPSVAPIPEETASVQPLPSISEGPLVPAPHSGAEEILSPVPLRSIDFVDISGETSSEDAPLQRKRSGEAVAVEAGESTAGEPEIEASVGARPSPEPAVTTEPLAFAENIEAAPGSSTPAPRVDDFEEMFSGTPPASCEAAGFGHLPIPRVTRPANRASESGARDSLVNVFPAPSVEPRRTRSAVVTVPEDFSFLSRPVGVASYLRPLVSDSDKRKMAGVTWQCLINEGMHAGNRVRFFSHPCTSYS